MQAAAAFTYVPGADEEDMNYAKFAITADFECRPAGPVTCRVVVHISEFTLTLFGG
jgi:hypothetical protein